MKNLVLILVIFSLASCGAGKKNQYLKTGDHQLRNGYWEEIYKDGETEILSKGHYNRGEKTGRWKTFYNGNIYQKENIRNGINQTKFYNPNGKMTVKGQSRTDISDNERHWYYFGDWKFYDEKGKLQYIKTYDKGQKVDSISFIKN